MSVQDRPPCGPGERISRGAASNRDWATSFWRCPSALLAEEKVVVSASVSRILRTSIGPVGEEGASMSVSGNESVAPGERAALSCVSVNVMAGVANASCFGIWWAGQAGWRSCASTSIGWTKDESG